MRVTINVGLSVGDVEPEGQVEKTLAMFGNPVYYRVEEGEWNGVKERVVVFQYNTVGVRLIYELCRHACIELQQESIAVCEEPIDFGFLVYADRMSVLEFNKDYFHGITRVGKLPDWIGG